jgi:hypothetical protein
MCQEVGRKAAQKGERRGRRRQDSSYSVGENEPHREGNKQGKFIGG